MRCDTNFSDEKKRSKNRKHTPETPFQGKKINMVDDINNLQITKGCAGET